MTIITIVAPGFLTVQPMPATHTTHIQVPQPKYNMTNFGTVERDGERTHVFGYPRIYELAYRTSISGQPMPLESTYKNQTYHLDFEGPAVTCTSADDSLVYNMTIGYGMDLLGSWRDYVSWLCWVGGDQPSQVLDSGKEAATIDTTSTDAARLFIMTNLGNWNKTLNVSTKGYPQQFTQVNVTECLLYNATYSIDFTFQYPSQRRKVHIAH